MFLTGVPPLDTQKYGPLVSMQCGVNCAFILKGTLCWFSVSYQQHEPLLLSVPTCNISTTVFTMFHCDFRPSTMTVKPLALHLSLKREDKRNMVIVCLPVIMCALVPWIWHQGSQYRSIEDIRYVDEESIPLGTHNRSAMFLLTEPDRTIKPRWIQIRNCVMITQKSQANIAWSSLTFGLLSYTPK
jgi:hypothetical protein